MEGEQSDDIEELAQIEEGEQASVQSYDSSWTSCTDSSCSDSESIPGHPGAHPDHEHSAHVYPGYPAHDHSAHKEDAALDIKEGLAQVEGEQFDDIEELAQVEPESDYDDWSDCETGMLC